MKKVKPEDLTKAIMEELEDYKKTTTEMVKKSVVTVSDMVKDDIRTRAPKRTGKYSRSWKVKEDKQTRDSLSMIVYTPSGYRISHLLEYGHANRYGGRTKAMPHIKPSEENGIKKLEELIKGGL